MIRRIRNIPVQKGGWGKVLRYIFVGISAVVVDFVVFHILFWGFNRTEVSLPVQNEKTANTIAVVAGFCYSFILHKKWAFRSEGKTGRQIFLMLLLLACNTVISNEAISFMIRNLSVPASMAKLVMQGAVAVWNYFLYDKMIYRR